MAPRIVLGALWGHRYCAERDFRDGGSGFYENRPNLGFGASPVPGRADA